MSSSEPQRDRPQHPDDGPDPRQHAEPDEAGHRSIDAPYLGPRGGHGISVQNLDGLDDLHMAKQFAEMIVNSVREGLLILDLDLRVQAANASFYQMFETIPEEVEGRLVYELGEGQWDIPVLRELLEDILPENKSFDDFEVDHDFDDLGRRVLHLNARQLDDHQMILLAIEDATSQQRALEERDREWQIQQTVLDALPVGVIIADADGRIIRDNAANRALWGDPPASQSWEEYEEWVGYWPETGERIAADEWAMARALLTGEVVRGELVESIQFKTGERRRFLNNAAPIRDADGTILGAVVAELDVTDRVRVEEALRASQERLQLAQEAAGVGTFEWNIQTGVNRWSPELERLYGLPEGSFGGTYDAWAALVHPEDRVEAERQVQVAFETGRFRAEWRAIRPDGGIIWVLARGWVERDAQGEPLRMIGANVDITELKRVEEALHTVNQELLILNETLEERVAAQTAELRQTQERLQAAIQASGAGIYDHRLPLSEGVYYSGRWADILGYEPDALPPAEGFFDWIFEQIHPDDAERVRQSYADFVRGPQDTHDVEVRLRHRAGHWVWVQALSKVAERDERGRAARVIGAMFDVSARKAREETIRELASKLTMAEQEERRRISQILHDDLQQLLHGIELKLSMIRRGLEGTGNQLLLDDLAEARSWIEMAVTTTRRLTVDLCPPILGGEGLVAKLEWLQRQMEELHGLTVEIDADRAWPVADEDLRLLLFRSVRELLFNVTKHAGVDRATVRLEEDEGHLVIRVIDEGAGFDVDEVIARASHDGGFGFFSVRERLDLVGGRLEVDSAPDKGTTVAIHAPVQPTRPN